LLCAAAWPSGQSLTSATLARLAAWLFRTLPRPLARRLLLRRNFAKLGLPPPPGSPLDHFPVVGYELPQAVAAGRVSTYGALVRLSPCTAHALELNARGRPRLDRRWRAVGNPQLVCVGYNYPTTEGWLQAIGRVAHEAAAGIAADGSAGA